MMIDCSCLYILIMFDVKLTLVAVRLTAAYSYEWVDGVQD